MGVLADVRAAWSGGWSAPSVSDDGHWSTVGGGAVAASSGIVVTEQIALSNPVVFDCAWILMDAIGQSPAILYDRTGPEGQDRSRASGPLAYRLRQQPNSDQSAIEFVREMQQSAAFYPHAYAEITWRGADPVEVVPRHPTRMRVVRVSGGRRRYEHWEDDGSWRPIAPENILRVPGRPVLRYAGETLGHAIALQRYSTKLFGKGVRPSALISTAPDEVWSKEAKQKLKDEIESTHGGPDKAGGLLIMDGRLKWTSMAMTNQEAELSALLSGIIGDLARWWRIPPYMIGLLESGTVSYASVNTQGVDFVVYCLMPWLVGWEQAMQRDLIARKDEQFVEFLTAAFMRGTTKERYDVYQIALSTVDPVTGQPIMSVDEIRRLENMNPHGSTYRATVVPAPQSPRALAQSVEAGSPAERYLNALVNDAAGRVVRREQGALAKLAERAGDDAKAWESGVREFYTVTHPRFVADAMKLPASVAAAYASSQASEVITEGPAAAAAWNGAHTDRLVQLALTEGLREVSA